MTSKYSSKSPRFSSIRYISRLEEITFQIYSTGIVAPGEILVHLFILTNINIVNIYSNK